MKLQHHQFLEKLRLEVESHPGVNHPMLARLAHVPFTKEDYKVMGLQHFPLVGTFTKYLELLLLKAPDSNSKQWIAKVLVDEYGEGSDNKDHAQLYQEYLQAAGATVEELWQTTLHEKVTEFVQEHLRICHEEPFLVGLGAVGPGHEWSIPKMFPMIVRGLRRAGFQENEILYFSLHMEQDVDHGNWLREALDQSIQSESDCQQIRRGACLSLQARMQFWTGVQDKIVRWRQPQNMHLRSQSRRNPTDPKKEITLKRFREQLSGRNLLQAQKLAS